MTYFVISDQEIWSEHESQELAEKYIQEMSKMTSNRIKFSTENLRFNVKGPREYQDFCQTFIEKQGDQVIDEILKTLIHDLMHEDYLTVGIDFALTKDDKTYGSLKVRGRYTENDQLISLIFYMKNDISNKEKIYEEQVT